MTKISFIDQVSNEEVFVANCDEFCFAINHEIIYHEINYIIKRIVWKPKNGALDFALIYICENKPTTIVTMGKL